MDERTALAIRIDHTVLAAEATADDVRRLCGEVERYKFALAMVQPCYVETAMDALRGSGKAVGTVVGFPFGANLTDDKAEEARLLAGLGASDLDMVMNVGRLKAGRHDAVGADIEAVVLSGRAAGAMVIKVIIEACLLTDDEKRAACRIVKAAGADFVKTSTGYLGPGANEADVALMRREVGPEFGVKASGGIRTLAQARALLAAGADRLGTSASVKIMEELQSGV